MTTSFTQADFADLQATIRAQEKTIRVLMDTVERQTAEGASALEVLTHNLGLERIVERKTEILRQQGEELQTALRDLQLTQAQLLQANKLESVGQLAAGIAHEINTPAQFIATNIDFLDEAFTDIRSLLTTVEEALTHKDRDDSRSPWTLIKEALIETDWDYLQQEIPAAISQTREGIRRISVIVGAMKEFSHPSSKEKIYNNINTLIETTVMVATNEWKYWATIETDFDPDLPLVWCLADEMGQALLNILINATHAIEQRLKTNPDSPKGLISLSTRREQEDVVIRIADDGCGMDPEILDRIFDPFFTTKGVGKGTGQGLAITHDVITKKHGGTIGVQSQKGKGSCFTLRLPIAAPSTTETVPDALPATRLQDGSPAG